MTIKGIIKISLSISLMYVTLGDTILPEAYGKKSLEVRSNINEYLISLFPNNKLETLKTRKVTIHNLERGNSSSPL